MGNESHESHGCHEGNESHEEEESLCPPCQASCLLWQDRQDSNWIEEVRPCAEQERQGRQQEEPPPWQAVTLDCSSSEGPQGTQDQGLCSYQEGHSTLQKGQGALRSVNAMSDLSSGNGLQLQMWGYLRLSSAGT